MLPSFLHSCIHHSYIDFKEIHLQTRCFIILFVSGQKEEEEKKNSNICSELFMYMFVGHVQFVCPSLIHIVGKVKSVTVWAIAGRGGKRRKRKEDLNINTFKRKVITKPGYNIHLGKS